LRYEFMYLPGEDPEQLKSLADVQRWLGDRRDLRAEDVIRIAVYRFHSRVSPRWRVGSLFFAGDAAHLMPPFAGQGMNAGIRDAFNLGWKLAFAVRGVGGQALLDSYETERKPHVRAMLKLSEVIGTVVMSRDSAQATARDVFLGAARRVPGLREYIAEMRFKPKASFTKGFVVPGRGFASAVGKLAPNPLVFDERNAPQRLDAVTGSGFALVSVGASGTPPVPAPSALLERLGARVVCLCSGEFIPLPRSGAVTAADTHGIFARDLQLRGDAFVLVRPDRIVAGACRPADFPQLEAKLQRRLA
jgi:3-(3-hydroxy-phenyl)propionate hydroxylase